MKSIACALAMILLCGCVPALNPEAKNVEVVLNPFVTRQGEKVGEVIGSTGSWYSYLFLTNPTMIEGALNDLRNNAYLMGSNRVYIYRHVEFVTSVTFLGEAYISTPSP